MSERTTDTTAGETRTQGEPDGQKWLSGVASLIGLWIAISPFLYEATGEATWNNVIVGAVVFLAAGYNYYRIVDAKRTSAGIMSLVALLGLWTLAAPYVMEYASDALATSNTIAGIVTAAIGAYVAYTAGSAMRTGTTAGTR